MPSNDLVKTKSAPKAPNLRPFLISLTLTLLLIGMVGWQNRPACNEPFREDSIIGLANGQKLGVEIAADPSTREKGLSGRDCLPSNSGMLFSFSRLGLYNFWMKDMRFAIDIVWIDDSHKIVTIKPNIVPSSYPESFTGATPAQYVLELTAGQAAALGLTVGQTLTF